MERKEELDTGTSSFSSTSTTDTEIFFNLGVCPVEDMYRVGEDLGLLEMFFLRVYWKEGKIGL